MSGVLISAISKSRQLSNKIHVPQEWCLEIQMLGVKDGNFDFFLQILPLKDDELVMSETSLDPRSLNPSKAIAMAICLIIVHFST